MNKRTELPTAENSSNFNRIAGATCQVGTTLENLKAAVCGETGASAKYAACAKLAKEKGYEQLGRLWEATSAAEQIPKDARGRFITGDGTVFQGYLFDEGQL